MLLKKQTVWLLTMLSLVVVLSVYYITSPEQLSPETAAPVEEGELKTEMAEEQAGGSKATMEEAKSAAGDKQAEIITESAGDEAFDMLRLEVQDDRNKMKEELTAKVASADLSAEDKNTAYEEMEKLTELATKENVLETLIKSKGYSDALVRADGENIRITVKSNEHSAAAANEIIRMAKDELGKQQPIAVEFQPVK
ncbi:SpoIIIAH-like family protein [Bacillus badius]|uniref:Stage III sporulation protein AH n=1 Tax=Bacillus badius TaxID=1455 RepID=A0ABR5AYR4_BACBA|nr:SpoIIIAH-like family protein [Bacillus badius]KIL75258.1 Stage III sporulation protein AH [Bacillus badius]KIL79755.1 Stage III sporulation protein AH [Bacillus badius]MED0664786.1 SpoIIIAH-like family protein [Bacillus badius]MED4715160.1 SpoIIIAH-like family protein [Bacillus badius]UAT29363.1 SpoIIIAH-like family protein [Bacillus badius]